MIIITISSVIVVIVVILRHFRYFVTASFIKNSRYQFCLTLTKSSHIINGFPTTIDGAGKGGTCREDVAGNATRGDGGYGDGVRWRDKSDAASRVKSEFKRISIPEIM
jgi:hypothetical protein